MSVQIVLSQKSRPYKIEVYGLQDDYLGTLQSYNDSFIGQISSPEIKISDDGSQTFTCSIPKFYIDPETNLKLENPRWVDINNGVLAENTRILKIFLDFGDKIKIYPFIVDKITGKRDSHYQIYKEIECSGLAFAELGKVGYKLELNSYTLESDYEKDDTVVATANYWLDKVFPNEKNASGKIVKWLTPWCYEIKMDWRFNSATGLESNKIYEEAYVKSWKLQDAETDENGSITTESKLVAQGVIDNLEKARYIDCSNSNKYNITQTIAETFEIFCSYEYETYPNGKFKHEYVDDNGNVWTGRKVVFYNRAIKTDDPIYIDYEHNLDTISKVSDSSEIYTKLYVTPIESSTQDNGYISIANTSVNPLLDDFILNFDYLYNIGSISDYQLNYIKTYELNIRKINEQLLNLAPTIENLTVEVNNSKSNVEVAKKESEAARETLLSYQNLRDNEVTNTPVIKNESNAYSVVFVQSGDISQAQIRLQGVATSTIRGFTDFNYNVQLFPSQYSLITVNKVASVNSNDENVYVVLDEYGYPSSLYVSKDHPMLSDGRAIIYLELTYSPKNAYEDICNQLEETITLKNIEIQTLQETSDNLQDQLDNSTEEQNQLLEQKEQLNQKLELTLGPALREGYWTPDSYEDPGQSSKEDLKCITSINWQESAAKLVFDTVAFEEEETGYYYSSIEDLNNKTKTYYKYIDISDIYENWSEENIEDLVIHLLNPGFKYTVSSSGVTAGDHYIIYNSVPWYFTSPKYTEGQVLEIKIKNSIPTLYVDGSLSDITFSTNEISGATNLTTIFEGINSYLGDRLLYNNAGFIFSFITYGNDVKPVLLLNNTTIDYDKYENISYSFIGQTKFTNIDTSLVKSGPYEIRYPRIIIYNSNVNYDSDLLTIIPYEDIFPENEEQLVLQKYYDYSILLRNGRPHITLKITNNNNLTKIFKYFYRINYQISRANEMLYLDAKTVAKDNSQPRYSYELKVSNTPDNIEFLELGQLCYINDHSLGVHAATGYISEITYKLDFPQDDSIAIKNYKTKFEDLFSTITASSEAMRNNQVSYTIAASGFNSDGTISGSVLQNSIDNNKISINYSNTNVSIDDTNGIVLTNSQPYLNGVYGQVILQGGGIFLSNAIDASGSRIWNTGITPTGINASLITTGKLDTDLIRIFAGNNVAFQWNGEGIFAYKQDNGSVDLNTYVRYSDKGIQYISNDHTAVDLGWDGLLISAQGGSTELTGDYGLTIYDGEKQTDEDGEPLNPVVRLGKFTDEYGIVDYGLRLYKNISETEEPQYAETLVTSNSGQLWLKDHIIVGLDKEDAYGNINVVGISGETDGLVGTILDGGVADGSSSVTSDTIVSSQDYAGISGTIDGLASTLLDGGLSDETASQELDIVVSGGDYAGISAEVDNVAGKSIRFWAGNNYANRRIAPFRVQQDGTLFATKANIRGDIYAESGYFKGEIQALIGTIGGWTISENAISSGNMTLSSVQATEDNQTPERININNNFIVDDSGKLKATGADITGTIIATGGKIGNLTIENISDAMGSINDITENMKNITVEISSSSGNVTKYNEAFVSTIKATIKRGGIDISEDEYVNYDYDWQCSDDGENWFTLPDSTNSNIVNYDEIHTTKRYIVCYVTEKEVSDGGDTITE